MLNDLLGLGKIAEAFERSTREARELVSAYYKPVLTEKGKLKAVAVHIAGLQRIKRLMAKADRMLTKSKTKDRILNEKISIPVLQYTFRETEEGMIDKWAGLLASSAAGNEVHSSFPQLLSQLSSCDAKLLDGLYKWFLKEEHGEDCNHRVLERLQNDLKFKEETMLLALENLTRLGLCREMTGDSSLFWTMANPIHQKVRVIPTVLGRQFVKACYGPKPHR